MDDLIRALRRILKHSAATIASVLTLSFSIGTGVATWSLLSAILLNPLPVREPDRLVMLGTATSRIPGTLYEGFIYPFYPHVRDSGIFEAVVAVWPMSRVIGSEEGRAEATVAFVTHDFFDVLGVALPIGRGFADAEDRRGMPGVAVLSDDYWRRTFHEARDVVGRSLNVAGKPVTIIGVAAPGFRGLQLDQPADIYLPFHTIADFGGPFVNYFGEPSHASSPTSGVKIIGRLRAGDTPARAAVKLSTLPPLPGRRAAPAIGVTPLNEAAVPAVARAGLRRFGRMLAATVALLLLIGCSTVGMLLLLRTEARREEFAVCLALGASRARLVRGIAAEGAVLAIVGAVLACPVAWLLFNGVRAFELPGGVEIGLLDFRIDVRALAVTLGATVFGVSLITIVAGIFGLYAGAEEVMRSHSTSTRRLTHSRTAALVTVQVAVALVLVSGAGLFARSLQAALALNPRIEADRVVTALVSLARYSYTPSRASAFYEEVRDRLSVNPAIRSMSFSASGGGFGGADLLIDGRSRHVSSIAFTIVDAAYFEALAVPILQGRGFSVGDVEHAPLVGIASGSLARFLGEGQSAIGRRLTMPKLVGLGLILGLAMAWMGTGTIRTLLFRVDPLDPATLAAVVGLVLLLAMLVSLRPALRAARVDLAGVLRHE